MSHIDISYPFNPDTVIRFDLVEAGHAELTFSNTAGQRVATLINGSVLQVATRCRWDGQDDESSALVSGVYLYRLVACDRVAARKLTLLR